MRPLTPEEHHAVSGGLEVSIGPVRIDLLGINLLSGSYTLSVPAVGNTVSGLLNGIGGLLRSILGLL